MDITEIVLAGVYPTEPFLEPLVLAAMKSKQFYLITLLVENGVYTSASPTVLAAIPATAGSTWTQWFLSHVADLPDVGSELLHKAIKEENYPLAAFLLSKGIDPALAGDLEVPLKAYAEALKRGTPKEQALRALVNPRNVAHLVGDSIGEKMEQKAGVPLEGGLGSESLAFLLAAVQLASEEKPHIQSEKMRKLEEKLQQAENLALRMESIQNLCESTAYSIQLPPGVLDIPSQLSPWDTPVSALTNTSTQDKQVQLSAAIDLLEEDLLKQIDKLPIGESILIPAGWVSGSEGHAITIEVVRLAEETLAINVINTGEGIAEFHGVASDRARWHTNTVRHYRISRKAFREEHLVRKVVEPRLALAGKPNYRPRDLYGHLEEYYISEEPVPEGFEPPQMIRKMQLSGTCVLRSRLAYCKLYLGDSYKEIKPIISERVMTFAVEQNEQLLDKQLYLQKLLSLAMPHLPQNFLKRLHLPGEDIVSKETQLARLAALDEKLRKVVSVPSSEHQGFPQQEVFGLWTQAFITNLQQAMDNASRVEAKAARRTEQSGISNLAVDLGSITTKEALQEHLSSVLTFALKQKNQDPIFVEAVLNDVLTSLGRGLLNDSLPAFSDVRGDPQACEKLLETVTSLANVLFTTHPEVYWSNPRRAIAFQYAMVIAWELSVEFDKSLNYPEGARLSGYGLFNSMIHAISEEHWYGSLTRHVLLDADLEADVLQLSEFAKKKQSNKDWLFLYHNMAIYGRNDDVRYSGFPVYTFSLKPRSSSERILGDYKYAESHASVVTDWTESDADYDIMVEKMKKVASKPDVDITREEWRVHWLYANGLPDHFKKLRRLAFLNYINTLGIAREDKTVPQLKMKLVPDDGHFRDKEFQCVVPRLEFVNETNQNPFWKKDRGERTDLPPNCGEIENIPEKKREGPFTGYIFGRFEDPVDGFLRFEDSAVKSDLENLGFSIFGNRRANFAIVEGKNESIREMMSLRTAVELYQNDSGPFDNPLVIPLLLDYFGPEHVNDLQKLDHRIFFEYTLFAAMKLPSAIRELPGFSNELNDYFKTAIIHFDNNLIKSNEVQSSALAIAFLYTLWQRSLVYMQKEGIQEIDGIPLNNLLENVRTDIKTRLNDPVMKSRDVQQQLSLALIESYHGEKIEPKKMLNDLVFAITTFCLYTLKNGVSDQLHPVFVTNAKNSLFRQLPILQKAIQDHPEWARETFKNVAERYEVNIPANVLWDDSEFPVYSCNVDGKNFKVDILKGSMFVDDVSPVSAKGKEKRVIDGKWYVEVTSQEQGSWPPLPNFANFGNYEVWLSEEKPQHYLMVDSTSRKPVYRIDSNGHITFLQEVPQTTWEWVLHNEFNAYQNIFSLDSNAFLIQSVKSAPNHVVRLILPNLSDDSGQPLEFERRFLKGFSDPQWVLRSKPHLIVSKQELPGIRGFTNFIVLERAKKGGKGKDREVLIPIKSAEEMKSNNTTNTSCVSASISKDRLQGRGVMSHVYLAYATLLQAHTPEEYERAMDFLQGARKFERYTPEELKVLGWIFRSQESTKDATGYADAVRLFAAWLVHDNLKRNPQKVVPSQGTQKLSSSSPPMEWVQFWVGKDGDFTQELRQMAQHYFARQHHLPLKLRLNYPENLSEQELLDWSLESYAISQNAPSFVQEFNDIQVSDLDIQKLCGWERLREHPLLPSITVLQSHYITTFKVLSILHFQEIRKSALLRRECIRRCVLILMEKCTRQFSIAHCTQRLILRQRRCIHYLAVMRKNKNQHWEYRNFSEQLKSRLQAVHSLSLNKERKSLLRSLRFHLFHRLSRRSKPEKEIRFFSGTKS